MLCCAGRNENGDTAASMAEVIVLTGSGRTKSREDGGSRAEVPQPVRKDSASHVVTVWVPASPCSLALVATPVCCWCIAGTLRVHSKGTSAETNNPALGC